MRRLLFAIIDIIASSIVLIPALIIYNKIKIRNAKTTMLYILFSLYLVAIFSLVGLPSVTDFQMDFQCYIIPFLGIVSDFKNCILNILLFIPLGIFIPSIWENFRNVKKTALIGFAVSMMIEVLQIFNYRVTDINDLITNLIGTIIGYYIANIAIKKLQWIRDLKCNKYDFYKLYLTVIMIMIFMQPFVRHAIYKIFAI